MSGSVPRSDSGSNAATSGTMLWRSLSLRPSPACKIFWNKLMRYRLYRRVAESDLVKQRKKKRHSTHAQTRDEAAGDCLALLRQGGPKPANWRWRVPGRLAAKIAPAPPSQSVPMVRPLIEDIDLTALASPDAVLWMTDTF